MPLIQDQDPRIRRVIAGFDQHPFLCNFADISVKWEGIVYPTSEHAFQAAKTLDINERYQIARQSTPGKAKHAGRQVKLREDWEQVKVTVMRDILRSKFNQNCLWTRKLIATASMWLLECNTWNDRIWGVTRDPDGSWVGQNHLGKCLMDVRREVLLTVGISDDWTAYTDQPPWHEDGVITAGLDCFHQ